MGGRRRRTSSAATATSRSRDAWTFEDPPVTAAVAAAATTSAAATPPSRATTTRSTCTRWSAKAFGFPRAIAHGMWTKARCLAALRLPDAFTAEVRFKKPILLPAKVTFGEAEDRFAVHGHLEGVLERVDVRTMPRGELLGRGQRRACRDRGGRTARCRCPARRARRRRSARRARRPPRTGWRARRRRAPTGRRRRAAARHVASMWSRGGALHEADVGAVGDRQLAVA